MILCHFGDLPFLYSGLPPQQNNPLCFRYPQTKRIPFIFLCLFYHTVFIRILHPFLMNGCKYFVNIHGRYALFYRNCMAKSMPVLLHLILSGFFLQTVAFPSAMFYNDYRMPKSCKHQIRRDLGKGRKAVMKNSDCQKMTGHSPFQWRNRGHVHRVLLCKTNRHSRQPASQRGLWGTVGRGESPLSQSVVDKVGNTRFSMIKSGCFPVCSIAVKPFDAVW